ncbi:xanthine phosphoribosyltransferase [Bombella sp. TMW 2.2559]|uniref:Xanthine-guanine phosphoribosyltransferase n=1 Tax=Bombella dulcis TaxID=2967339 RepID=A0ABT3WEF4_9PROT|nr:xanthine phosphoribosyltransferase [Bombella dulcis]MCX5615988.1 xanthine phosphoribosyltransferase [Bombella dulcis]
MAMTGTVQTRNEKTITYATVTWDQMHCDARLLAATLLRDCSPFRGIVAITRGGLIPAAILGRELGCRLIESISVASYAGEEGTQQEPELLKAAAAAGDGEGFLIVDDLVDSGVTARYVRRMLPKAVFACLYAKPDGRPHADHFVTEVPQDTWVLFPWDMAPQFIPPLNQDRTV